MTKPHLLELAKQGDPQAIAMLMNRSLQPRGMTAIVDRQGDRLRVTLEAEQVPNRQALTTFVQNGIANLGVEAIKFIQIFGHQSGSESPAWEQTIVLADSVTAPVRQPPSGSVAPPSRPAPPPPPPLRSTAAEPLEPQLNITTADDTSLTSGTEVGGLETAGETNGVVTDNELSEPVYLEDMDTSADESADESDESIDEPIADSALPDEQTLEPGVSTNGMTASELLDQFDDALVDESTEQPSEQSSPSESTDSTDAVADALAARLDDDIVLPAPPVERPIETAPPESSEEEFEPDFEARLTPDSPDVLDELDETESSPLEAPSVPPASAEFEDWDDVADRPTVLDETDISDDTAISDAAIASAQMRLEAEQAIAADSPSDDDLFQMDSSEQPEFSAVAVGSVDSLDSLDHDTSPVDASEPDDHPLDYGNQPEPETEQDVQQPDIEQDVQSGYSSSALSEYEVISPNPHATALDVIPSDHPPVTETVDESSLPPRRRSNVAQSALFGFVLLVVVGWIAALIGYTLWRQFSSPPEPSEPLSSPASSASTVAGDSVSTEASPSPDAASDPAAGGLDAATESATRAIALAEAAQSVDDWTLVAQQWQEAIAPLEAIPSSDADYAIAQQRLAEYRSRLASAQQQADNPLAAADAPGPSTTITVSGAISCQAVESTPDSKPVELTNVQLSPGEDGSEENQLIGCVTNHTNRPINTVAVTYTGGSEDNPNLFQGGFNNLEVASLEPGQTVPFTSSFSLSEEVTRLTIESIFWTPIGASEPQEIEVSTVLNR